MLVNVVPIGLSAPNVAGPDHFRVGIAEDLRLVEAVSGARIPRSGKTISVLQVLVIQLEYDHGIDVADAEFPRKLNFNERLRFVLAEEYQSARIGGAGEYGKIHSVWNDGGPEGKRTAPPEADAARLVRGVKIDAFFHCRAHETACTASASELTRVKKLRNPVWDITVRISSETPSSTSLPFLAVSSRYSSSNSRKPALDK